VPLTSANCLGEAARPRRSASTAGGWSPKLFRQLVDAGFDILTYRKGPSALLDRLSLC